MKNTLNNIDYERIDEKTCAFIRGELSASEEASFKKELENNSALLARAANTARLMKAMIEVGTEKDQQLVDAFMCVNKAFIHDVSKEKCPMVVPPIGLQMKSKVRLLSLWTSIAACLILVFVVGIWWNEYSHTTQLGKQYSKTFVSSGISHGEADDTEKELDQLFVNARENIDAKTTIKRLEILYEVSVIDEENRYSEHSFLIGWYLCIAYLQNNQKDLAIDCLKKMKQKGFEKSVQETTVNELLNSLLNN